MQTAGLLKLSSKSLVSLEVTARGTGVAQSRWCRGGGISLQEAVVTVQRWVTGRQKAQALPPGAAAPGFGFEPVGQSGSGLPVARAEHALLAASAAEDWVSPASLGPAACCAGHGAFLAKWVSLPSSLWPRLSLSRLTSPALSVLL